MVEISDKDFEQIVADAMDAIPERYAKHMNYVGITWEEEPTPAQREKLRLRCDQTLYGLYEGIPLTQRNSAYNLVLPDKITIFKRPLQWGSRDPKDLKDNVAHTLWHEVGHHFGLDHDRIHELERKNSKG
jgi:predicted Zn-dependent protease with MMP-like domain